MEGTGEVECTQNGQNKPEDVVQTEKSFLKLPSPLNCSSGLCECSVFLFSSSGDKEGGRRAAHRRVKWRQNRDSQNRVYWLHVRGVLLSELFKRLQLTKQHTIKMQMYWDWASRKYQLTQTKRKGSKRFFFFQSDAIEEPGFLKGSFSEEFLKEPIFFLVWATYWKSKEPISTKNN